MLAPFSQTTGIDLHTFTIALQIKPSMCTAVEMLTLRQSKQESFNSNAGMVRRGGRKSSRTTLKSQ